MAERCAHAYARAMAFINENDVIGGAADCSCVGGYFGGAADEAAGVAKELREYESSLSAKAKEEMIRRLARAMQRAGIAVNPEGDLDAVVAELVKQLPNPKHGKTFAAAAEAQQKVCRVIADVLNDEFSPGAVKPSEKLVDTSLSAVEICRQVGEWAHSFSAGVNTEFLAVHASVKNAVRQLEVLEEVMGEAMRKIRARIAKTGDAEQNRDLMQFEELYSRAAAEHKRTMTVLKNILQVQLPPAAQSLEIAMRDHSELSALMKKVNLKPGTSQFSDTLASAISGLGTAASVAHRVHKALKAANMSIRDYLDSPGFEDLERKLDARVESGKIPPAELSKFLSAVADLRSAFGERRNPQFESALESFETPAVMGGEPEAYGGAYGSVHEVVGAYGGADEDENKTATMRQLEKSRSENEIIIKDFARRLARHYDEFLTSVKSIGPHLGKEIPLTDHSDALRNAIDSIRTDPSNSTDRLELALIGRYADAEARKLKEVFMGRMRQIANACEDLVSLEMYRGASSHFARILAAVTGIEKTIDYYSTVFSKKVGLNALEPTSTTSATGYSIESVLPEIASSALSLQEAVNEFVYLYYVARIRVNLTLTGAELDSYGKDYSNLLGDAIASKIRKLEKENHEMVKYLEGTTGFDDPASTAPVGTGVNPWPANFTGATGGAARKEAAMWVRSEYKVKVEFYRAIQAIDLYLKSFTKAVALDAGAISDIKKLLDGAQVISRWFNQSTGDAIWQAFEECPTYDTVGREKSMASLNSQQEISKTGLHYYQSLETAMTADDAHRTHLGIPEYGQNVDATPTSRVTKAKKAVVSAYDNFQALKNLINAFARIGDVFGGRELRSEVFMSPTQIYKALVDYLKQSAMSINAVREVARAAPLQSIAGKTLLGEEIPAVAAVDPWQVYFGSTAEAATGGGNYTTEDGFFKSSIKAIAAKILTVLGVYDMFERTGPIYQLTPVRIIVGGADGIVTPIEDAAELYYRLPRLAEFYYSIFNWDSAAAGRTAPAIQKIALLADFEGTFSGLIRFIFLRTLSQTTGDYSDSEVQTLVGEINAIYEHYKSSTSEGVVGVVINEFVKVINQRYGIIKKSDYDTFMATVHKTLDSSSITRVDNTNYAILPGEGEVEVARRAPSDRFYERSWEKKEESDPFKDRASIGDYRDALEEFRTKLFNKLSLSGSQGSFAENSNTDRIKHVQRSLAKADASTKMHLVSSLIRSEQLASGESSKTFIFHETVVVGLNMLASIEAVLRRFSNRLAAMDTRAIESGVMNAIYAYTRGGQLGVPVGNGGANAHKWPSEGGAGTWMAGSNAAVTVANHPLAVLLSLLNHPQLRDQNSAAYGNDAQFGTYAAEFLLDSHNVNFIGEVAAITPYRGRSGLPFATASENAWLFAEAAFPAVNGQYDLGPSFYPGDKKYADVNTGPELLAALGGRLPADANAAADVESIAVRMRKMRLFARLITDYQKIMAVFLEEVFALTSSSGGLLDISIGREGIRLGYTKLQDTVERILTDVKAQFDAMRPHLTKQTIERYEGRSSSTAPVGSIQWVEKELMDVFFRNQDIYMDPSAGSRTKTMEGLSRKVRHVFEGLIRKHNTMFTGLDVAALQNAADVTVPYPVPADETQYEWYGSTLAGLVYYDATRPDSGIDSGEAEFDIAANAPYGGGNIFAPVECSTTFNGLIATQRAIDAGPVIVTAPLRRAPLAKNQTLVRPPENLPGGLPANALAAENARRTQARASFDAVVLPDATSSFVQRLPIYDPSAPTTVAATRSLMFSYNQLVARFIETFTDTAAGRRIYLNLINSFANGTASGSVFNPSNSSHPDLYGVATYADRVLANPLLARTFGTRGDPMPGCVLVESLGWVLQRIMRDGNDSTQISDHLLATLTDVPLYMKEVMRANLPSFIRLFDTIVQKCDYFKQIIQKTSIRLNRQNCAQATGLAAINGEMYMYSHTRGRLQNAAAPGNGPARCEENCPGGLEGVKKCLYLIGDVGAAGGAAGGIMHDSATMRTRISAVLDGVSSGSIALITSSKETLQELADDAIYCQMGENAIEQYAARNGKQPLMPLSMLLFFLRNNTAPESTDANIAEADPVNARAQYTIPYINYQVGAFKSNVQVGNAGEPASIIYPGHSMGVPSFRLLYGVRGLLVGSSPIDYEHIPGVRSILDTYNGTVSGSARIMSETYIDTMRALVNAMRWVTDARCVKALISPYVGPDRISVMRSQFVEAGRVRPEVAPMTRDNAGYAHQIMLGVTPRNVPLVITLGAVAHPYWDSTKNAVIDELREAPADYGSSKNLASLNLSAIVDAVNGPNCAYTVRLSSSLERVLQITESSDQGAEMLSIVSAVAQKSRPQHSTSRGQEQINNLIEMNIIPINVHALMRGVPLANVYNYEVSFDQFVKQMLGVSQSPQSPQIRNASQMMVKLLHDPYCEVDPREYGSDVTDNGSAGFVHRIFRGDTGIGMGRPKFLSDQIFNKALFGSVYQSRHDYDEAGPLVGIGASRGRANDTAQTVARAGFDFLDRSWATLSAIGSNGAGNRGPFVNVDQRVTVYRTARSTAVAFNAAANNVYNLHTQRADFITRLQRGSNAGNDIGFPGRTYTPLHSVALWVTNDPANMEPILGTEVYELFEALLTAVDAARGAGNFALGNRTQLIAAITRMQKVAPVSAHTFRITLLSPDQTTMLPDRGGGGNDQWVEADTATITAANNGRGRILAGMLALELLYRRVLLGSALTGAKGLQQIILDSHQFAQIAAETLGQMNFHSDAADADQKWRCSRAKIYIMECLRTIDQVPAAGAADAGGAGALHLAGFRALIVNGPNAVGVVARNPIDIPPLAVNELSRAADYAASPAVLSTLQLIGNALNFRRAMNAINLQITATASQAAGARVGFGTSSDAANSAVAMTDGGNPVAAVGVAFEAVTVPLLRDSILTASTGNSSRNQGTIPQNVSQQFGGRKGTLTWLDHEDSDTGSGATPWQSIKRVELPGGLATKQRLEAIGNMRFNTRFVRNMFFITNVMRIVRMKLARELAYSRSVLRSSHMAVAAAVTEYGADPFSPNEVYASTDKLGVSRYDDQGSDL